MRLPAGAGGRCGIQPTAMGDQQLHIEPPTGAGDIAQQAVAVACSVPSEAKTKGRARSSGHSSPAAIGSGWRSGPSA